MKPPKRFFLAQDNSYHWHLVDASRRCDWSEWIGLKESDPQSWVAPDFAKPIERPLSTVEFENPTEP